MTVAANLKSRNSKRSGLESGCAKEDNYGVIRTRTLVPLEWKRATIIPIRKPGKSRRSSRISTQSYALLYVFAAVEKLITENSSIGLFTDDIVLWHSSHDIPSIEDNLSQCLSRVATNHKISYNLTKSVPSFFITNRHLYKYQPTVFMSPSQYGGYDPRPVNRVGSGSNPELKRNSPFSQTLAQNLSINVEHHCLTSFINPVLRLQRVTFHYNLMPNVNKMSDHPELLKQLALEVIAGISLDVAKISTDGSLLGNLVVDDLAKAATSNSVDPENHMVLTSTEIYFRAKEFICRPWVVPPVHPWYFQRHPGSSISFKGSR
ncbi:RNase H domain-containing protein [Trichonephila clavipes]|nr:RNase H domain-containing protein [Trichonephila clavipes]